MPQPTLTPVDGDPFSPGPTNALPDGMKLTPVDGDPFKRAPGTLGKVEAAADNVVGATSAGVNALGAGVAQGAAALNKFGGLALAGAGKLGDAILAGTTGAHTDFDQDAVFKNFVAPSDAVSANAQQYIDNPAHPTSAAVGGAVGRTGFDMATMVASDGLAEAPQLAVRGTSALDDAVTMIGNALRRSTVASSVTGTSQGVAQGERTYDDTGNPIEAVNAGLTETGLTDLGNALPISLDGQLAKRIALGAVAGTASGEAQRSLLNQALPGKEQTPFSWGGVAQSALFGAALGGVFHGPTPDDPALAVQRYNTLQDQASQGDPLAAKTTSLVSDLTAVDGLSNAALDAAEVGAQAGQAAANTPHESLIASSDRYRQIYQAAQPDLDPTAAAQYANAVYSQEVATNGAWSAYTSAKQTQNGQLAQAKIASEIKQMLAVAQDNVPPAEMNKLTRWAFEQSRGTLAVRDALRQTVEDRAVPDYVEAAQGDNFHPDGALTQTAFDLDNRPDLVNVRYPDTPAVAAALKQNGVVPYRLNDGTLALLGRPEQVDAVADRLTQQGIAPTGEDHANPQSEVQPGDQAQEPGADGRDEEGLDAAARPAAEAGQPAQADGLDQGQAAEVGPISTAPRAQPVVDALVDRGTLHPVDRDGVITLSPDVGEQAARHAMDVAAGDTYLEPTEAQAKAGNYRKGGVLFKSPHGDIKVRIETPDGAVRKGPWGSRKIRGAHYGYIPGTRAADGDPVDVLLTRHAHDDSRPVAVINQHWKDGLHDEIKVVMGAANKAEALQTYAKQYPPGLLKSLLPNGKRNIVMMSREKFVRYLHSGQTDVPPHPVSGLPMAHLRREVPRVPEENPRRAQPPVEAAGRQAQAPGLDRGPGVRRLPETARREAPPPEGLKRVASDAPVYQHGQGAHPVSVVGVHYSGVAGLKALDPAKAGTGSAGAETRRYGMTARSTDPLDRPLYFYVRSGKHLPPKEDVVSGQHAYESRLNNLYDVAADPEGIVDAGGMNKDAILEDIHEAGYDGVVVPTEHLAGMPPGHVVQLFGDAKVPVKAVGHAETPRAMFAGRGAQHASLADLKRAKALESAGQDAKAILQQTGWAKGKDGQWRFELSDRNAQLTPQGERELTQPGVYHLGDVLDHPALYRAYPELKAMPVHVDPSIKGAGYHPTEDAIYIHQPQTGVLGEDGQPKLADLSLNLHAREMISQLLHEAQHAIQAREGFEGGAGIRDLDYNTRAGEVEARNVMGRRRLTDEQRRQFSPEYTEDVPREKQTLRPEGLPTAAAEGLRGPGGVRGSGGRVSPAHRAGVRPVEGLPATVRVDGEKVTFGPNPRAVKAAADYAKSAGLPYQRLKDYAPVDEARAKRIAQAYEAMKHDPGNPEVKAAYDAMIRETQAQWEAIKKTGLKVDFIQPGQPDPYASNPRKAIMDVNDHNHLWVFPTDAGFGSDASFDVHDNPLLAKTGETINGHALRANDVFRIVHDYFGHIKEGFGFRADGEENAWRSHSSMYSPLARRAMTTETRGQNSWVNYGPYAESNRTASGADTHYADQKIGLLPEWVTHEGAPEQPGEPRAALNRNPTLYSGLERTLESAKNAPKKAPAKTWVGWLDGAMRRGEIKQGERDWVGLDRWLEAHKDESISRDEVMSYIRQNKPEIEVKRLSEVSEADIDDFLNDEAGADYSHDEARDYLEQSQDATKYDSYKLPGGENYQEHLLRLPMRVSRDRPFESPHWDDTNVLVHVRMDDRSVPKATPERINELVQRVADAVGAKPGSLGNGAPGLAVRKGVVTPEEAAIVSQHLGFKNVDTTSGNLNVKHIHEIQSDWHQEGRKKGYAGPERDELAQLQQQYKENIRGAFDRQAAYSAAMRKGDSKQIKAMREVMEAKGREGMALLDRIAELKNKVDGTVPDAPFKQTKEWSMLGIKHAVLEAISDGDDAIEWDTGATNADRYSLRKVLSAIDYYKNDDGTFLVRAHAKGGDTAWAKDAASPEEIERTLGKEVAQRMLNGEGDRPSSGGNMMRLTGDNLEVGGKGMHAFYDKLLVNEVNQWAKKFGGKVEQATTPAPDGKYIAGRNAPSATVHRLMITPAMREAASEGLPMFHLQRAEEAQHESTDQNPHPSEPHQPRAEGGAVRQAARAEDAERAAADAGTAQPADQAHPADAAGTAQARQVSHAALSRHVDGFMAHLKGRASYEVQRSPADLAADHPVRRWADAIGAPKDLAGVFYNGRMYLFSDAIRSPAEAERVTLHEMVGHGGMRAVFGKDYEDFLDAIVPSAKKTPLWDEIADRYLKEQPNLSDTALADEYMAALAEDADRPDARPVWRQMLSATRNWLRSHGFSKLAWTEDDLKNLIRATYRGIRDGRISVSGKETPTVTFDEQNHMSTSTYVDGKGQRGYVDHFDDSSRDLRIGGLEATGLRTVDRPEGQFLDVGGELHLESPKELIHLARFAGEEHLDGALLDKAAIDVHALEDSGVPFRDLGDAFAVEPSQLDSPMASLRNRATGSDEQERILKKTIAHDQYNMSWADRMQQMLRDIRDKIVSGDTSLSLKQGYVDQLASIAKYERNLNGGLLLDAAESAYKAAWMAKNTDQILAGVMKLGVPEHKSGTFMPVAGRKGLMDVFKPLYQTKDGKSLDMLWEGYAYARRANELIQQMNKDGSPREKLLDQGEIDELLKLGEKYPVFKQVLDDYQTFNQQLLDLAVDRGALSPEMAEVWKANTYVPFYRALEDESHGPGRGGGGISGKKVSSQRLHGSEVAAQPIIENIIKNSGAILDKIYSNEAMRRVVALTNGVGMERVKFPFSPVALSVGEIERTLQKIGMHVGGKGATGRYTHFVPQSQMDQLVQFFRMSKPVGHDIVSVMENGKPIYYKVNDPLLLRSITAFNDIHEFDGLLNTILGVPKKLLTLGVTLDPRFMYRNLLRDTVTAWVQSGSNPNLFNPIKAAQAAKEVYTDGNFINALRVAGYNGNEYFQVDQLREHLQEMHGGEHVTVLNTPKKLYHAYHKIGFVSEQLNRVRIAQHVIDQGGSLAEAAWQAQNTLNFQMHGDNKAMQLLIRGVPFLNARIQGLNRLYDGMLGRDSQIDQRKAVMSFLFKSIGLVAAGLALDAKNWDDPRYQRIPEASKDLYYHFFVGNQHYMLPKPFEIGSLTGTLPERVLRVIAGKDNKRYFVQSMIRMVGNTFQFDPTPQVVAPLLQDWANRDSLTGNPIINQSEQDQLPQGQYSARTSATMKAIAQHMPGWAPGFMQSPDRLEHLYQGYTGMIGTYLMQAADALLAKSGAAPSQPTSRWGSQAVGALLGTFGLGDADTDPRTKYLQQFYDAQDAADQTNATLRKLIKEGHVQQARELLQDNRTPLAYRTELHAVGQEMKLLRQAEIATYQSTSLDPDAKRARLTQIQQTRVKLLDRIGPMLDLATDFQ